MSSVDPQYSGAKVLVVGDVMLDRYWIGPTSRISPEAPVPVVRIQKHEDRPGGAANVALNIASLGGSARLLGVVGKDEAATRLKEGLASHGIACDLLEVAGLPTITKLRVLSRNQQLIRLDFEESLAVFPSFDKSALLRNFEASLSGVDAIILSDYAKGTLDQAAELIKAARGRGLPVLVDPKGSDYSRYRGATLVKPNLSEFEAVVGPCATEPELIEKGERLCQDLSIESLLVTRSENGMVLIQPGKPPLVLHAEAREVFDVTGAGDTVIATLAASLAIGLDLTQACRLANFAAGIVVGKLGTATVTAAELHRSLRRQHEDDSGVLAESELLDRVADARAKGQTIVMTNGCFDILHVGHVRYLEAARRLGDVLIVAVNEDASVARLKGSERPLNRCGDRMKVLSALRCVDWVVSFSEDTPARLIEAVLPDVLVKGGDYEPSKIAGHDAVTAAGGKVLVLDYHAGYSTSSLIDRARHA